MLRLVVLTLLVVAGCAGPAPALTVAAAAPDPTLLRGWWRVEGSDQVVLIDPGAIEVQDGDRTLTGTWKADGDGRFLARIDAVIDAVIDTASVRDAPDADPGVVDDPVRPADLAPPWLGAAAGFRIEDADRVLLDRSGAPVARLAPAAQTPGSGLVDPGREPDGAGDRPGPAAPVPAPLVGPTTPELAGDWVPAGATNEAFLRFDGAGTWSGSDGCNRADGSWLVGADGGFLATAPAVRTLMFCEGGADVATQADLARRAAFDGPDLVLLDVDGAELGRYHRASPAGTGS